MRISYPYISAVVCKLELNKQWKYTTTWVPWKLERVVCAVLKWKLLNLLIFVFDCADCWLWEKIDWNMTYFKYFESLKSLDCFLNEMLFINTRTSHMIHKKKFPANMGSTWYFGLITFTAFDSCHRYVWITHSMDERQWIHDEYYESRWLYGIVIHIER